MAFRILTSCLILISVLFFPFWISILLAILAIVYFNFYWEAIVLFFISDLMFGIKEVRFINVSLVSTIIVMIILVLTDLIKKKLKFYNK